MKVDFGTVLIDEVNDELVISCKKINYNIRYSECKKLDVKHYDRIIIFINKDNDFTIFKNDIGFMVIIFTILSSYSFIFNLTVMLDTVSLLHMFYLIHYNKSYNYDVKNSSMFIKIGYVLLWLMVFVIILDFIL